MVKQSDGLVRRAAVHGALADPHRLQIVDALWQSDLTPGELARMTGLSTSLLAFHLRALDAVGLIDRHQSQGDRRRRYIGLRPGPLRELGRQVRTVSGTVLFVCTHNSARSQLAAALWRDAGGLADSAGADPATEVHPLARRVARQHDLDLLDARPRAYGDVDVVPALVVSVCDRARESDLPFDSPRVHWSVPDPVGGALTDFEAAFDDIAGRVERLSSGLAA